MKKILFCPPINYENNGKFRHLISKTMKKSPLLSAINYENNGKFGNLQVGKNGYQSDGHSQKEKKSIDIV